MWQTGGKSMQVFKLYLKIIKKNLPGIMLYLGIFLFIVVLITTISKDTSSTAFEQSKVRIAYINEGAQSPLTNGFRDYLKEYVEFVEVEETEEGMRDALFFRIVEYIIIVPDGFVEGIEKDKPIKLKKLAVSDSTSAAYLDMNVENYFNTARNYIKNTELSLEEIVDYVKKDLDVSTKTNINAKKLEDNGALQFYFNYSAYALTAVLIIAISSIMLSLGDIHIKRRNRISPIPIAKSQFQQVLGLFIIVLFIDLLLIFIGLFFRGESDYFVFVLLSVNLLSLSIAILSIAYLVGTTTRNREAANGIANILSLGFSFLSGVFVPRELLGEAALQIGKFTPTYWFVMANDSIFKLSNYSLDKLSTIFISMAVQYGFGVAFFAIALVISKKNRTSVE